VYGEEEVTVTTTRRSLVSNYPPVGAFDLGAVSGDLFVLLGRLAFTWMEKIICIVARNLQ
jgi:hypothetical protein